MAARRRSEPTRADRYAAGLEHLEKAALEFGAVDLRNLRGTPGVAAAVKGVRVSTDGAIKHARKALTMDVPKPVHAKA